MLEFPGILIFYLIRVMNVKKESYGENSEKQRGRPAVGPGNPGSISGPKMGYFTQSISASKQIFAQHCPMWPGPEKKKVTSLK